MDPLHSHPLSERAELQALEPWQAEEFHEFVERARAHIAPWLLWPTTIDDTAKAERWLRRYAEHRARDGIRLYGIRLDGRLVGGVGFSRFDADTGVCELGAFTAPEAQGHGLVTRAAAVLTDWAMVTRGLSRVEWRAATVNVRSIAVAKRLGMRREAVLREAYLMNGVRHDLEVWALVAGRDGERGDVLRGPVARSGEGV
ncbi:GNAT family N-acetyltransferase [Streptomyces sp. NPDC020898]|uniref:GNAT family N-acetyltransferase n=1 Tax=Streptomyces sp. NPDC020898 TaxID=3365101 RepID=UPI00379D11AC